MQDRIRQLVSMLQEKGYPAAVAAELDKRKTPAEMAVSNRST